MQLSLKQLHPVWHCCLVIGRIKLCKGSRLKASILRARYGHGCLVSKLDVNGIDMKRSRPFPPTLCHGDRGADAESVVASRQLFPRTALRCRSGLEKIIMNRSINRLLNGNLQSPIRIYSLETSLTTNLRTGAVSVSALQRGPDARIQVRISLIDDILHSSNGAAGL